MGKLISNKYNITNQAVFTSCPTFYQYNSVNADASFLDEWSFDQFQSLLNRSTQDPELKELLLQDNLVIFLHLLGCDSNGHAHRPFSSIYLNNVKVVDHIAERVYSLLENYYKDNRTSYIFTADHGMSDKGWYYLVFLLESFLCFFAIHQFLCFPTVYMVIS
jgi:glucan phosphoethanolaminetransferase (alkaline phosphatase superfamily)